MYKIEKINLLLKVCEEFHTTLNSYEVYNMNSGVNLPDYIDPNSAKWRTFVNQILSLDTFIGKSIILDDLKNKVKLVTRINYDFVEDLIVELNALKDKLELENALSESTIDREISNDSITSGKHDAAITHKLFISHASKDGDYVKEIVCLLESLGLQENDIICSSVPPYNIPLGEKVYDWLVNEFQCCDLHMIFVLSNNYYDSVACLNEMGAAWALKHNWTGILLPSFDFSSIKGCIDSSRISIKLDDKDEDTLNYRLEEFKNNVTSEFNLRPLVPCIWERKRNAFLGRIREVTQKRPKQDSETQNDVEDHLPVIGVDYVDCIPPDSAFLLVYADAADGIIMLLKDNNTFPYITIKGNVKFTTETSHKESARWIEALDRLIEWGWVKRRNDRSTLYDLTGTGHKKAEWLKEAMQIDTSRSPLEQLSEYE